MNMSKFQKIASKILLSCTLFMGNHLCAWADSPTIVELPSQYKEDEVYALLHSIDFHQLAQEADKFAPGLLKDKVSFHFELLTFHSFLGKPDHMAVRIDVNAPQNWNKVSDLKTFLANYLEKKFSGAKRTTTILQ